MKISCSWFSAVVASVACALSAGAGIAQSDVEQRAPELKIYDLGEINLDRYEVVGRPWVDSWWDAAFSLPTFPSQEQAIAALRTEAARRGANGLTNVMCLDQGPSQGSSKMEQAILCYGIAIRVRPGQG